MARKISLPSPSLAADVALARQIARFGPEAEEFLARTPAGGRSAVLSAEDPVPAQEAAQEVAKEAAKEADGAPINAFINKSFRIPLTPRG